MSTDDFNQDAPLDLETFNEESSDIPQTTQQCLELLERAWLNEKLAPQVLPHKFDLVNTVLAQISYIEENLQDASSEISDFEKTIYRMEIDRLRYVVASYVRTRLEKIETYVCSILNDENERVRKQKEPFLTADEIRFAMGYRDSVHSLLEKSLHFWIGEMPDDWKKELPTPNLNSFVFVKSNSEIDNLSISEDIGFVDLKPDEQVIIFYKSVADLLENDSVHLV